MKPDKNINRTKLFKALSRMDKRHLDDLFHKAHEKVFSDFDCLTCANCCKSIPPLIREADLRRIAAFLKMKPSEFSESYIKYDDDGSMMFNTSPCPFLESDNTCRIYDHRPLACAEYPHTDRVRMYQILELTRRNEKICPAIIEILNILESDQGKERK